MANLPDTIVFFDGECLLCDRAVQWMVRHDPEKRLRFAPLGGESYQALTRSGAALEEHRKGQSMVFARRSEDGGWVVSVRSDAVIGALAATGGAPRRLALLRLFPRPLRDLGYRIVAAARYRIFGRVEACSLVEGGGADRLLP